jgi:hypothetical protein
LQYCKTPLKELKDELKYKETLIKGDHNRPLLAAGDANFYLRDAKGRWQQM